MTHCYKLNEQLKTTDRNNEVVERPMARSSLHFRAVQREGITLGLSECKMGISYSLVSTGVAPGGCGNGPALMPVARVCVS